MSHVIPALSVSAINVNGHFPPGRWQYHADLAQAIGFGGLLLLLSYIATILLLLKRSLGNIYRVWLVACLIIYGVSELVIFNKYGFAFFIACWALYSAAQDTRLSFSMSQSE